MLQQLIRWMGVSVALIVVLLLLPSCGSDHGSVGGDSSGVLADTDGDGVADDGDLCPGTAPGASVDADGCSADQTALDNDGDGVNDLQDLCPNTPAGAVVNANGCPDTDGDGVSDDNDICPATSAGTTVDSNGCNSAQGCGEQAACEGLCNAYFAGLGIGQQEPPFQDLEDAACSGTQECISGCPCFNGNCEEMTQCVADFCADSNPGGQ